MGYKTEQFVLKVDEHLICAICQEVLQDPWQCKDGHVFCRECIIERLMTNQKCPLDKKPLQVNNLVHNLIVKNMIDNLDVYCHQPENDRRAAVREEKCDWTGKLRSLPKHRETCPFQQVQCPHVNCNEMMQKRKVEDHDEICKFKRVTCEKCKKVFVRHVLQIHKDVNCPEVVVPCPNGCSNPQGQTNMLRRVDLDNHLINICAKTIVDCPFKDQGCLEEVERRDVEKHVQFNMAAHMMLMAKQCSFLTKQNSSLTKQCSSLTIENQALKDELTKVKEEMRGLQVNFKNRSRYVWKILDYPSKARKYNNGIWIRSPTFWLCGYSWFLKLYPNGDKESKGFVSLYLVLSDDGSIVHSGKSFVVQSGDISVSSVQVQVENHLQAESLVTHNLEVNFGEDPNLTGIREMMSGIREVVGMREIAGSREVAGVSKFMKATDANSSSYCNVEDFSLTITCYLMD